MEIQKYPILPVRFKIPEPRKNFIVRENIFHKLDHMEEYKVTIVKAGAGSGKTTLLCSYAKCKNKIFNWLSLDDHMNEPYIFWRYVIEELKKYTKDKRLVLMSFFEENTRKENLYQFISLLINCLYQKESIFIVLDDFQSMSDRFLLDTLDYFIKNVPDNVHIVLISRNIPDIYLGELSMQAQLLLIDESDIKMNEKECREFLIHTLQFHQEESTLQEMINSCDGWIGGLQLMAVAYREGKQNNLISKASITNRVMDDYITKEIFSYLVPQEQNFLIKTSILPYFNRELIEQYLPEYNFDQTMESVIAKNLFVINIDENLHIYRYHAILKDYLIYLFEQNTTNQKELRNRAAQIYYQMEDYEESLNQLFVCRDYQNIMKQLLEMPQTLLTFMYIMKVPMEEITKNIDFAYQYFFCYYTAMDFDACERIYHYIAEFMQDDSRFIVFKHADLFFNIDKNFKTVAVASLEEIDQLSLNLVTKAYLLVKEAYVLFASERFDEAETYLQRAQTIYERTGNDYIAAYIILEKVQILELKGELNEALNLYKTAKLYMEKAPGLVQAFYIGIAGVYISQLNLVKAKEALEMIEDEINSYNLNLFRAYRYTLAGYLYVCGECDKTEEILQEFSNLNNFENMMDAARILNYPILRERYPKLAEEFLYYYENIDENMKYIEIQLLYAQILFERGRSTEAMEVTDQIMTQARKRQNKLKIVEGALLKVLILFELKCQEREMINLLMEAIFYANQEKIGLPFLFHQKDLCRMVQSLPKDWNNELSTEEKAFLDQSLRFPDTEIKYGLSKRESEVMKELSKGCTNKQIAEDLCISLATVKSHIINIYGKMEVNNRIAAVNKWKLEEGE